MIVKGQKISDRYEIIKSIGEGGMANVYLAYDTILERNVAVKVLRGDLSNDEKFVRRFQREALQASSLMHENIVEVYDVGEDNGAYYIVMEYVQGKNLKMLIKKRGKLTTLEVVDILLQVTAGLSVAHDSYIIHRDIKPQNIMILENGIVKIMDFGIAVALNSTQLTQTNSVMGSVHYLPPEQASGKGATLQSDIYSVGILMYELLTGKLPYHGDNAVEIALKHLKEPLPSVRAELPDLPQSVENIILKATAKNPKNRYADAREMHEDLKTCLDPARKDEKKYTFAYSETEISETKSSKTSKDKDKEKEKEKTKEIVKEPKRKKKKDEGEEVIAKRITESDLKKQNKGIVALLAIFTSIVVLITTVIVLLPYINKSKQAIIPDVENMTIKEATKKLQDAGFEVADEEKEIESDTVSEGKVVETRPIAGAKRKVGTTIILYISAGNDKIKIEDYIGKTYQYVYDKLTDKGLQVFSETIDIEEGDTNNYSKDIIIDQSVKEGEYLSKGDTITLMLPNIMDKYPDFTSGAYNVSTIYTDYCQEYNLKCTFRLRSGQKLDITDTNASKYDNYVITGQSRSSKDPIIEGAELIISIEDPSSSGEGPSEDTCTGDFC